MSDDRGSIMLTLSERDVDRINRALDEKAIREEADGSYDEAEPHIEIRQRIDQQFHKQRL